MKIKNLILAVTTSTFLVGGISASVLSGYRKPAPAFAYTNGDAATYYNSIDFTKSGTALLKDLQNLNKEKRKTTVGYSSMGTSPSGQFKYTDYDPNYVQYDSNGQPYGTRISSFYTYTSATSWNREHVWPDSHGGGSKSGLGAPYVESDIHMPRPTITEENSSRGNSYYVEGMNHSSNGWDPKTAGYDEKSRGEAARIVLYCVVADPRLELEATDKTSGGKNKMGNLETILKWCMEYEVTQREKNRNEGAEYLQGNRNPFIDHRELGCRIWGNATSKTKEICQGYLPDDSYNPEIPDDPTPITPTPTPTPEVENINVAQALTAAAALADKAESVNEYKVTGVIVGDVEASTKVEGTYRFKMGDAASDTNLLTVYWASFTTAPQTGDTVSIQGKLKNFVSDSGDHTYEIINGVGTISGSEPAPGGDDDPVTPTPGGDDGGQDTPTPVTKVLSKIEIKTKPTKVTYSVGQELDFSGLVITATYADGSTADISDLSKLEFKKPSTASEGEKTVYVSYAEGNKKFSAAFTITVTGANGCHGSVIASSALISITSLMGLGMSLLRKKK